MTLEDKVLQLQKLLLPDEVETEALEPYVREAEETVLNRLYPFGLPDNAEVPVRYEGIQVRIALELYNKRGAEGETAHTENGTQRVYETGEVSSSLLKQIVPFCGSVILP